MTGAGFGEGLEAWLAAAAARARHSGEAVPTPFLDPGQRERALQWLREQGPGLRLVTWGGYRGARRQRGVVQPAWEEPLPERVPLAFLQLDGEFPGSGPGAGEGRVEACRQALLAAGLAAELVGDLIAVPGGVQAVVGQEAAAPALAGVRRVAGVPVRVRAIDPEDLEVPPHQERELEVTVASLRLDAVVAAGLGLSRARASTEVRSGRVKVNGQAVQNPSRSLKEGDRLAVRGRGLLLLERLEGATRKGRLRVVLRHRIL